MTEIIENLVPTTPVVVEILVPTDPEVIEVAVPGHQGPPGPPGPQGLPSDPVGTVMFVADGGGYAISPGVQVDLISPFAFTIDAVTLLADREGSITFDIWRDGYDNFPPDATSSICGASKPSISSATRYRDSILDGWTTSIPEGAVLRFNVDEASSITRCTIALKVTRQNNSP